LADSGIRTCEFCAFLEAKPFAASAREFGLQPDFDAQGQGIH